MLKLKSMQATKNKLIISNDDYETLSAYVKGLVHIKSFDNKNATLLVQELKKAKLVAKDKLPGDVVRLNSRVSIKEATTGRVMDLTLVIPEKADIKMRKVSVFAPIGTALIGFRQGQEVVWDVPAGTRTFTIMNVYNDFE